MDQADDREVWVYAQNNDLIIVTRDSDYKVIWIRRGNCSTSEIETMLRSHLAEIQTLIAAPTLGILTLY